jgi:hypothetical protein
LRRAAACLALALSSLLFGCGGGGEENAGRIEVSGGSAEDERIGNELRTYIERDCRRVSSLAELRASIARAAEPSPAAIRRYLVRRYGSIEQAFQSSRQVCRSYRSISVDDGVITVETALEDDRLGRIGASDVCNTIQGSDVADFTRGHSVLGRDGERLATCPAGSG